MMVGIILIVLFVILYFDIDFVWFGIFFVIMMELVFIMLFVGMNFYVV